MHVPLGAGATVHYGKLLANRTVLTSRLHPTLGSFVQRHPATHKLRKAVRVDFGWLH
jgi:hypothetical protein